MPQKVDPAQSRYKNYLPACVKCENYRPGADLDPFGEETQCTVYGDIPKEYLLMDDACDELYIPEINAFIDVGDRPLTLTERMAADR